MPQKQTTTKVITLIYDVTKSDESWVDDLWQSYCRNEIELEQVLKELKRKKWLVETRLIPDPIK
jgi:hypothetical protein